jgi:hypothetical protein
MLIFSPSCWRYDKSSEISYLIMFLFICLLCSWFHVWFQSDTSVISSRNQNKFLTFKYLFLPEPLLQANFQFSHSTRFASHKSVTYSVQKTIMAHKFEHFLYNVYEITCFWQTVTNDTKNCNTQNFFFNPLFLFLFRTYERTNHMFCDLKELLYLNENKILIRNLNGNELSFCNKISFPHILM